MVPRHIEPRKFAQHGLQVAGEIPVDALQRLGAVAQSVQAVEVSLQFGVAETKHRGYRPVQQSCRYAVSALLRAG